MKTKVVLTSMILLLCGSATRLLAQDVTLTNSSPHWYDSSSSDLYQPYDVSVETFAVGTLSEHTLDHLTGHRIRKDGRAGGGAGLEFFFNRYIGIEGEGFAEGNTHNFVNAAGGNLVLRLPIGNSGFAPYIFGGGGHQYNPVDCGYADGGAGIEYRFARWIGLFVDGRWVATDEIGNYGEGRLGLKFTF